MPFNGSGTFVSLPGPDFPALPGTTILASSFNANMNDVFTNGLTKCLTRDGQSPPTANLPMAGFKLTGVGNGSADTDSAALGQTLATRGQVGVVDWDTRVTNGIFEATAASLTSPAVNFPPTSDLGQLAVIAQGAIIQQIYTTANNIYFRQKLGGSFSSWTFGIVNPNYVMNGEYNVWQGGASSVAGVGKRYLSDMNFESSTGTTNNPSQQTWPVGQTDVDATAKFFKRVIVASVAGAGNGCFTAWPIESVRTLAGKKVVFSFYAKANSTLPVAIEFVQSFGAGGGASADVSTPVGKVTLTTSWARYSVTVTLPSISGKTVGTSLTDALTVNVWMDAGTSFNTRASTLGQQSGTFDFWGVKLEEGSIMTPFRMDPVALSFNNCRRYFAVLVNMGFAGVATAVGQLAFQAVTLCPPMLVVTPGVTFALGSGGSSNMGTFSAVANSTNVRWGGVTLGAGNYSEFLDLVIDSRL